VDEFPHFPYKSYCWAIGTTSFRTVDFNVQIERQIDLLEKFWALPKNDGQMWQNNNLLQVDYYNFLKFHGFVDKDAPRPDKDARQKTSGLVDIGLIDDERRLTYAGRALLSIVRDGEFARNNLLQIPADSFVYLKQLLKTSNDIEGDIVRPFVVVLYAILRLGLISNDEFTYLIPLCTTRENTEKIIADIKNMRNGIGNIDEIILSRLMGMENYKDALSYFLAKDVTEAVITVVGMNRKSRTYDKPYFHFFNILRKVVLEKSSDSVLSLYTAISQLNGKPAAMWRQYLFNTTSQRRIECEGLATLHNTLLIHSVTESDFKRLFFQQMHIFKARATLGDYFDLNRRYFRTTDAVIFDDGKVIFDSLPNCWLHSTESDLLNLAFSQANNLTADVDLSEIATFLTIDEQKLYANLKLLYGITVATVSDANRIINDERYKRFNTMITERFNRKILIGLLEKFEAREDEAIRQAVTNNANIPTIFEYILGIAWYLISECKGDVLSYMNLSLEADLLPRSHATGGNADIEYAYEQTATYPAHTLLIEATLADSTNQRRMEMEPVSRHLGEHILSTGNTNAYCVFISTYLHRNVISDFRHRKNIPYYGENFENVVQGMKILPLATTELRTILEHRINYEKLYDIFEKAFRSHKFDPMWYEQEIMNQILV